MSIRLVNRLFALFNGRNIVHQQALGRGPAFLRLLFAEQKFEGHHRLPEQVYVVLVQEAYKRAGEKEPDKLARFGEYYRQMESIANSVIAAFNGQEDVDPRIRSILTFHRVLIGHSNTQSQ